MSTTVRDLIEQTATTHNIHPAEALDEVWDAIDLIYAPEEWPEGGDKVLTEDQIKTISSYIAHEYATNRTRL
jgi:hypothetical protein